MQNSNWNEFDKGLGAGAKHDIGQAAADESINEIVNYIQEAIWFLLHLEWEVEQVRARHT